MPPTIFSALCTLCDDLDSAVRSLDPGAVQDRFRALVVRLDDVIEQTVGLEQPMPMPVGLARLPQAVLDAAAAIPFAPTEGSAPLHQHTQRCYDYQGLLRCGRVAGVDDD